MRSEATLTATDGLERLRAGNRRFASDARSEDGPASGLRPEVLAGDQRPFAVVLGCSDSRVPVEIVFDQGLGDLFVIRVAGNIVAPSQIASVEFAAEQFGTRLVVVLGHSRCGAVMATLDALDRPSESQAEKLYSIVDRIRPAVASLPHADRERDALVQAAVRANVRHSVEQLRRGSGLLEQLIRDDGLLIVGAEYSLETGCVDFLDGAPGAGTDRIL